MEQVPTIPVFRAITGKESDGISPGVTDDQLRKTGSFTNNLSPVENDFESWSSSPIGIAGRRVEGLPVFLDRKQAESWLSGRKFKNPPVIAEINIPLNFIDEGKIDITRNFDREASDYKLDRKALLKHLNGEKIVRGECFISGSQGVGLREFLQPYEQFFRPNLTEDGFVDNSREYDKIELELPDQESSSELNTA